MKMNRVHTMQTSHLFLPNKTTKKEFPTIALQNVTGGPSGPGAGFGSGSDFGSGLGLLSEVLISSLSGLLFNHGFVLTSFASASKAPSYQVAVIVDGQIG